MTKLTLPSVFYPIAPSADLFIRYVRNGAKFVQIRIKDRADDALREDLRHCLDAAREQGATAVINDYWREAINLKADFIHLGQEDLQSADIEALKKHQIRIGVSTHDDAELERALALTPDYIALGPIFFTRLKAMAFAPQGVEKIKVWKEKIGAIPLVAIGGMTIARGKECLAAGADCVSVVTDISLADDPESRLREWIAALEGSAGENLNHASA